MLKISRIIFRFINNLQNNLSKKNFPQININIETDFFNYQNINMKNFDENEEKELIQRIKNSTKRPKALYEINQIKKFSTLEFPNGKKETNLKDTLAFREEFLKFNSEKIKESIIDFSMEFKRDEEIKLLENLSKLHSEFLFICFDNNKTYLINKEEEKTKRYSVFACNNLVLTEDNFNENSLINPQTSNNFKNNTYRRKSTIKPMKSFYKSNSNLGIAGLGNLGGSMANKYTTTNGSMSPVKTERKRGLTVSTKEKEREKNVNNYRLDTNENIKFTYSMKFSDVSLLIKNFLDYYKNMIYVKESNINNKFREIFSSQFENSPNKEFPKKLKEFIDQDICLIIIRHCNRETFTKEDHEVKYVLLFLILILPQMNLNINFRNHLTNYIADVAERK